MAWARVHCGRRHRAARRPPAVGGCWPPPGPRRPGRCPRPAGAATLATVTTALGSANASGFSAVIAPRAHDAWVVRRHQSGRDEQPGRPSTGTGTAGGPCRCPAGCGGFIGGASASSAGEHLGGQRVWRVRAALGRRPLVGGQDDGSRRARRRASRRSARPTSGCSAPPPSRDAGPRHLAFQRPHLDQVTGPSAADLPGERGLARDIWAISASRAAVRSSTGTADGWQPVSDRSPALAGTRWTTCSPRSSTASG